MTPTWAPPRAGRACRRLRAALDDIVRPARLGDVAAGSPARRRRPGAAPRLRSGGSARPAAAARRRRLPGRGSPSAVAGSRPTAARPAGRPAPRGSAHRPGSPCRVRRARHGRASARARRLHARGRSAAAAAPPGPSSSGSTCFAQQGLGEVARRGRAAVRARRSASVEASGRRRPDPPAVRRPAATATPGWLVVARSTSSTSTQTCPGRSARWSRLTTRICVPPGASASSSRWISWRSEARACSSGRRLQSSSASRPRSTGRGADSARTPAAPASCARWAGRFRWSGSRLPSGRSGEGGQERDRRRGKPGGRHGLFLHKDRH